MVSVILSLYFSFLLTTGYLAVIDFFFLGLTLAVSLVRLACFHYFGLYKFSWRYGATTAFMSIFSSVFSGTIGFTLLTIFSHLPVSFALIFVEFLLTGSLIFFPRCLLRMYRDVLHKNQNRYSTTSKNIVLIGAGDCGELIAREILKSPSLNYNIIGFIDDKSNKTGKVIHNIRVLGTTSAFPTIHNKYHIDEALITMPSANSETIRPIITTCKELGIHCKTTPGLTDIIGGHVSVSQLRAVQIEDILRRETVELGTTQIADFLSNKTILVTGAGGSIGSEICRQVLKYAPKTLIILDHAENSLYNINMDLINTLNCHTPIIPIACDIKDKSRLSAIFKKYSIDIVFHAAAYKHVPLMEENVAAVIENNILGTKNLVEVADAHGISDLIHISTDKAVRTTNCMGATKRLCEILIQATAKNSQTNFSAVRFGNVLGSQGSVVPLFKKQISNGGPLTVTHPDMTRYFMTIPEAVSLVLQTGALSQGGEIFILDMGNPVKILDLARDMIHLSGLKEGKDIHIEIVGLRPGEKLQEELFFNKSNLTKTPHKKIFVTHPANFDTQIVIEQLTQLVAFAQTNPSSSVLRKKLLSFAKDPERYFNTVSSSIPTEFTPTKSTT